MSSTIPDDLAHVDRALSGLVHKIETTEGGFVLQVDPLLLVANNAGFKAALREVLPNYTVYAKKNGVVRLIKRKQNTRRNRAGSRLKLEQVGEAFETQAVEVQEQGDDGAADAVDFFAPD
jgi:hypothetical protein